MNDDNGIVAAVKDCQSGKLDSFALVYDAYVRRIYAFVYQKTFNRDIAEDLVSKTFLKAMKAIGTFDSRKASFNTWIYAIARNIVIDHYRSSRAEDDIESVFDLASSEDLIAETDNRLLVEEVRKRLDNLDRRQREIVLMRLWDGLSYREIGELVGMTSDNAKVIFFRAIGKLRGDLAAITALMSAIFLGI